LAACGHAGGRSQACAYSPRSNDRWSRRDEALVIRSTVEEIALADPEFPHDDDRPIAPPQPEGDHRPDTPFGSPAPVTPPAPGSFWSHAPTADRYEVQPEQTTWHPAASTPETFDAPVDFSHAPGETPVPLGGPVAFTPPPVPVAHAPALTLTKVFEELVAWFKTLVSAAVYATLIVTFGFQVARVEGESMAPTLENQDRLIVNKLGYRLHKPAIGDIVMLYYPLDPDKSFVKRVVAEPGDTIKSVEGHVYRNDVLLRDDFIPEEYRSHDTWGPEVVREGFYYVMGDHRNNSSDSRAWGLVPEKYIIGKVELRWWPVSQARIFGDDLDPPKLISK
jgi:signal peptidase I